MKRQGLEIQKTKTDDIQTSDTRYKTGFRWPYHLGRGGERGGEGSESCVLNVPFFPSMSVPVALDPYPTQEHQTDHTD